MPRLSLQGEALYSLKVGAEFRVWPREALDLLCPSLLGSLGGAYPQELRSDTTCAMTEAQSPGMGCR